jgi:LytS/YehU family sensor histidine kinase
MILQPFIENSIEYGFKNNELKGKLQLDFVTSKNQLFITIHDNGSGSVGSTKNYPSRASQIIQDRLILLNKKYRSDASFKVLENDSTKGYTVKITLPLLYKE